VRVVELGGTGGGPAGDLLTELGRAGPATLLSILDATTDRSDANRPHTGEQRRNPHDQTVSRFTRAWFPGRGTPHDLPAAPPDLSGDRYAQPLEVLFEAFDRALDRGRIDRRARTAARAAGPRPRAEIWDVSAARAEPRIAHAAQFLLDRCAT